MEDSYKKDFDWMSDEELDFIKTLAHNECIDDGIYPQLNFMIDEEIQE